MSFNFIKAENVDLKTFKRCVNKITLQNSLELHIMNDSVMKEYDKNINDFISYLIKVGEYLQEYEYCSQLVIKQKTYKKWLQTNLDTVKSISELVKNLTDIKYDEEND
jgi:hypothetical protein